jgi:predicted house-cleaning noncanonical NTP pyrophosphatase (MazG superfamily)
MSDSPLCDILLKNCKDKRKASWARRFARALQTEEIPENTELEEAVIILESILRSICTSAFEKESLMTLLENDGTKEAMADLLPKVVARFEAKASHGIGVMAKGPNRRK